MLGLRPLITCCPLSLSSPRCTGIAATDCASVFRQGACRAEAPINQGMSLIYQIPDLIWNIIWNISPSPLSNISMQMDGGDESPKTPRTEKLQSMLKRVPTFLRVQEALTMGTGALVEALPICYVNLVEYVILAWTTSLIGRAFGEYALSGTSLGFMTFNLGFSMQRSFMLGLDTQAPQAFGSRRFADVGLASQRGAILALALSILVATSLWFVSPVLLLLGQPPVTVLYAAR